VLDGNEARPGMVRTPGGVFWWVAPNFGLSQRGMRWWKRVVPKEAYREEKSNRCFILPNQSELWFKSADSDSLIGEGVDGMALDESARIPKDKYDVDLRATLADKKGWAAFYSTPRAKNWFYDMWTRGNDRAMEAWAGFNFPTLSNPEIDPEEIEEVRKTIPDHVYRQEFLAEFLEDSAGVFRNVEKCIDDSLSITPLPPRGDIGYCAGLDLAKYQNFTVLTILDDNGILVYWDRWHKIEWPFTKARVVEKVKTFGARLLIDSTGIGDPLFDDLSREGIEIEGYKFSQESKKALIESLSIAIEQEKIHFPRIPELVGELQIFEYEFVMNAGRATGRIKYGAPAGYYDDCVDSLALANWMLSRPRRQGWIV
jgi:hypothetical protein